MQSERIVWISSIIFDLHSFRGYRVAVIEILKHLAERGIDVYFFAVRSKRSLKEFDFKGSRFHLVLVPLRYSPIITSVLFAATVFIFLPFLVLIKRPSSIVMKPGPSTVSTLAWKPFLRALKIKVVLDVRSTPVLSSSYHKSFRGSLDILWFNISLLIGKKMFDGITTITSRMKKQISSKFNIRPEFIGVWTSGVSTTLFKPENYDKMRMRKRLGLTNKFIVFYHGDFNIPRGIIESIASIKILEMKCNDIVLFLLGNGPALTVWEELIRKNGVQDKVITHDAVDYVDVPKYIAMCDIGIVPLPDLPDWRNQCPLKLLEYLAMKKVVIVTDIPANREVIENSKCGVYVPSADPKEIAEAIRYVHDNREKLTEWGSYGRAIIEEKFDWKKVAKDFENYISQC